MEALSAPDRSVRDDMVESDTKKLKNRWDKDQTGLFIQDIQNGTIKESPFGLTNSGYQDYRGLSIEEPLRPINLRLEKYDFSHSKFNRLIIAESALRKFIFDFSTLIWGDYKSTFCDLSFKQSNMRGSGFGGKMSSYENCDFSKANMSGCNGSRAVFKECSFEKTSLNNSILGSLRFEKSVFSGDIKKVMLSGNCGGGLLQCDFSKARFFDCAIRHMQFQDCTFSESSVIVKNWPNEIKRTFEPLSHIQKQYPDSGLSTWISVWTDTSKEYTDQLFDLNDLKKNLGKSCGEAVFNVMKNL